MNKRFTYTSYKGSFQTVPDVIDHMRELHNELRRTDLSNLQFFNITYLIITKSVYKKIGTDYFQHDEIMKNMDINFARYYFDALKEYADGKPTTPSWQVTFDCCRENSSIPIIYLALGVNAHVNNDLGLSLFDVMKETDFTSDYAKVNPVIFQSVNEVIKEVGLSKVYKPFMQMLIYHWRYKAWNNYKGLKQQKLTKNVIEKNALALAESLAKIHSFREFYHLYKII